MLPTKCVQNLVTCYFREISRYDSNNYFLSTLVIFIKNVTSTLVVNYKNSQLLIIYEKQNVPKRCDYFLTCSYSKSCKR